MITTGTERAVHDAPRNSSRLLGKIGRGNKFFREHPFKKSLKAERVLEEILGNRDFRLVMDPG